MVWKSVLVANFVHGLARLTQFWLKVQITLTKNVSHLASVTVGFTKSITYVAFSVDFALKLAQLVH
jgi:hypothetical protein